MAFTFITSKATMMMRANHALSLGVSQQYAENPPTTRLPEAAIDRTALLCSPTRFCFLWSRSQRIFQRRLASLSGLYWIRDVHSHWLHTEFCERAPIPVSPLWDSRPS